MTTLHFAQISDIHISVHGDHDDMFSGRSAGFLKDIVAQLNRQDDLDFVLITGDLFDAAIQFELDSFNQVIHELKAPYYVIPGNHDRREINSAEGLTRHDFAHRFNPQYSQRPSDPKAQAGYWSLEAHPEVQLIGLDSIRDEDFGGQVDDTQIAWLQTELAQHRDKMVIVAIHHPLHKLAPIDDDPYWYRFVCDTGPEMLSLLDNSPQVKLVLTGHHHLTKVDKLGQRLHMAGPAIAIYPCAYRTFRLIRQAGDAWQLTWQTHNATDKATIAEAYETMVNTWQRVGFEADFVQEHVPIALGSDYDRTGTALLK